MRRTDRLATLTAAAEDALRHASTADASTRWLYPYDGTVFPQGLAAPELMWDGAAAGDAVRVHFHADLADIETFAIVAPPARFALRRDRWDTVTSVGGRVELTVDRLGPGASTATHVVTQHWTIAPAPLPGVLYYQAGGGRVVRLRPGALGIEEFLTPGACHECHAVSADGTTLILGGDEAISTYDLTRDVAVFDSTSVGIPLREWAVAGVSRDGRFLLENNAPIIGPIGGQAGLFRTMDGARVAAPGVDGVLFDMPAFSPDGTLLAFVDHATHDLGVLDFDASSPRASGQRTIALAGADHDLNAIAFPTVSPMADAVAYHRGRYPDSIDTRNGPGTLFLTRLGAGPAEVRLAAATGDGLGARDVALSYMPFFAPTDAGGYAWIAFVSRRTYGNRLEGTANMVKQLWIAAIDSPPEAIDPSHPAFWLPGQELDRLNGEPRWAAVPP